MGGDAPPQSRYREGMRSLDDLLHRTRIADRIVELFVATDARQWERVKACFAPRVHFDMSSLSGHDAEVLTGAGIAARWETGLAGVEAIHHQAGNFAVTLEEAGAATAFCYAIATHYRKTTSGRNVRTFVGSYGFHLTLSAGEWLIDSFRFNLKYSDGNMDLEND